MPHTTPVIPACRDLAALPFLLLERSFPYGLTFDLLVNALKRRWIPASRNDGYFGILCGEPDFLYMGDSSIQICLVLVETILPVGELLQFILDRCEPGGTKRI